MSEQINHLQNSVEQQAGEAPPASEAGFQLLVEAAFEGVAIIQDGKLVEANRQLAELLGYEQAELIGLPVTDAVAPEARAEVQERILSGYDKPYESVGLRKDGSTFPVEVCGRSFFYQGKERRIVAVHDITERKRLEQQSEERRLYLENLLDCAPDAIVTLDKKHCVLEWNRGAERLFGYSHQEVRGQNIDDLIAAPDAQVFKEASDFTQQVLAGKPVSRVATVRYRKDRMPVHVILAGAPILVEDELVGIVAVYTDISERKRAEEEIRRRAAHLEALNTVIAAAAAAPDLSQLLTIALHHTLQALGLEMGAIWVADQVMLQGLQLEVGQIISELAQAANLTAPGLIAIEDWEEIDAEDGFASMRSLVVRLGVRATISVPILAEGQSIGGLSVNASVPRKWSGDETALVAAVGQQLGNTVERLRLLQEVHRQAEELESAVAQLRSLDLVKSEFMQNVSHELRTPLTLIVGYAELLAGGELGDLSPIHAGPVESIVRQSRTLSALVTDITLLLATESRIIEPVPVAFGELVRTSVEDYQLAAKQAGLELTVDVAPHMVPVRGESVYLRRVAENLLDNAIKFTSAGGKIEVWMRQEADQVILRVSDTGVGISPEEQVRVFERFYQVDGTSRRRQEGAGLGLALVKEIVEAYGGTVDVQSQMGEGSTFTVRLPALKPETDL